MSQILDALRSICVRGYSEFQQPQAIALKTPQGRTPSLSRLASLRGAGQIKGFSVSQLDGDRKTRSMFDRYNIIDQRDVREALRKLESSQKSEEFGHNSAITPPKALSKTHRTKTALVN